MITTIYKIFAKKKITSKSVEEFNYIKGSIRNFVTISCRIIKKDIRKHYRNTSRWTHFDAGPCDTC